MSYQNYLDELTFYIHILIYAHPAALWEESAAGISDGFKDTVPHSLGQRL